MTGSLCETCTTWSRERNVCQEEDAPKCPKNSLRVPSYCVGGGGRGRLIVFYGASRATASRSNNNFFPILNVGVLTDRKWMAIMCAEVRSQAFHISAITYTLELLTLLINHLSSPFYAPTSEKKPSLEQLIEELIAWTVCLVLCSDRLSFAKVCFEFRFASCENLKLKNISGLPPE